jgi:hypothetical protein
MYVYKIKTMFFLSQCNGSGYRKLCHQTTNVEHIFMMLSILYVKCTVCVCEAILLKHYLVTLLTNNIAAITMAL